MIDRDVLCFVKFSPELSEKENAQVSKDLSVHFWITYFLKFLSTAYIGTSLERLKFGSVLIATIYTLS